MSLYALHMVRKSRIGFPAVIVLFNTLFFALMATILPIGFEENDDVMMAMIANGSYSGIPDGHLVYINVLYGWLLAGLYTMTSAVEWYTLSFSVLQILSMSVLSYCVLTMNHRARWEKILWLVVLYVLWIRVIIAFQFTTTAGLLCLAGSTLLLRESRTARWSGVVMVAGAALIRFYAAGLVGLLMAPIIVYTYRKEWYKYIAIVMMLATVVGCRMANQAVYDSHPEWRYYREYNKLRAQLNDNPNAYTFPLNQLPEGVDAMDYQLLMRFIPDAEQIDLAAMRQLNATIGSVPMERKIHNLYRLRKYATELVLLAVLFVLMILTTGNRTKYLFLIGYSLFVCMLIIHVSLDGFLKNRVFLCMLLPMLVTDFMLLPDTTGLKRRWGIGIVLTLLSGWYLYQIYAERVSASHHRYQWTEWQQPLLAHVPDGSYVTTIGASMSMEAVNPWRIWNVGYHKYNLGWATYLPLNKSVGHSYRALLRDDMYIFTDIGYTREHTALQRVCEQIEKHYGVQTSIHWICKNRKYALVKLNVEN